MKICAECGAENIDNGKFCTLCGAKLPETEDVKPDISLDTPASDVIGSGSGNDAAGDIDEAVNDAEEGVNKAASDMENAADNAFDEMKGNAESSKGGSSGYEQSSYSSSGIFVEDDGGKVGFAIAALVCGCLSILCCFGSCCFMPVAIAAIVLGIICIVKDLGGRGLAIAGIITGGIGILLEIIFTIVLFSNPDIFNF